MNSDDALSKIFNTAPIAVEVLSSSNESTTIVPESDDTFENVDANFVRAKHYEISEKGSEALGIAMRVVRETEDIKAIEALAKLIKSLADANRSLLAVNKDKAEIKSIKTAKDIPNTPSIGTAVQNQQNIIFTSTSKGLNKMIADMEVKP